MSRYEAGNSTPKHIFRPNPQRQNELLDEAKLMPNVWLIAHLRHRNHRVFRRAPSTGAGSVIPVEGANRHRVGARPSR